MSDYLRLERGGKYVITHHRLCLGGKLLAANALVDTTDPSIVQSNFAIYTEFIS